MRLVASAQVNRAPQQQLARPSGHQVLGSLGKLSGATSLDMTTMSGQRETFAGTTMRNPDQRCAALHPTGLAQGSRE